MPLGLNRHVAYHHKRIQLEPGDVLVLYSEGVTSLQNGQGEMFGSERLDTVVRQSAPRGAEAVKTHFMAEIEHFLNGFVSPDDLTFLIMERQI